MGVLIGFDLHRISSRKQQCWDCRFSDAGIHAGLNNGYECLMDVSVSLQAAARQAKFESSAGGRAARKALDNVKKEREADAAARKDNAKEWLS
jgi:hypothetical protein